MNLELETERLSIRPLCLDDVEALHEVLGDAEAMVFYNHPFSRAEVVTWIERSIERYERDGCALFAVEDRITGELLGDNGPSVQTVEGIDHVELGWHTRRSHWGRGIATEAGAACREWAFATLDIDHLISLVQPANVASCRVAEKLGFTVAREVDFEAINHHLYWLNRP